MTKSSAYPPLSTQLHLSLIRKAIFIYCRFKDNLKPFK